MTRIRVIPVLLLKNFGLVKTIKFKNPSYIGDPINAVRIFNEKEVDEIVLLDINASIQHREPDFEKIKDICSEAFMPFAYGGGITNIEQIKQLFQSGIEKVVINTQAYYQPKLIEKAASIFGSQSIVVSIDVKKNLFGKNKVYINSGTYNTKLVPAEYAKKMTEYGAGEIFLTSIEHEGTYKGYFEELISSVSSVINVPLVANGGAASIKSFLPAVKAGASAVAAGSMFVYQGNSRGVLINYPSQIELKKHLFNNI
jgi:cyclase